MGRELTDQEIKQLISEGYGDDEIVKLNDELLGEKASPTYGGEAVEVISAIPSAAADVAAFPGTLARMLPDANYQTGGLPGMIAAAVQDYWPTADTIEKPFEYVTGDDLDPNPRTPGGKFLAGLAGTLEGAALMPGFGLSNMARFGSAATGEIAAQVAEEGLGAGKGVSGAARLAGSLAFPGAGGKELLQSIPAIGKNIYAAGRNLLEAGIQKIRPSNYQRAEEFASQNASLAQTMGLPVSRTRTEGAEVAKVVGEEGKYNKLAIQSEPFQNVDLRGKTLQENVTALKEHFQNVLTRSSEAKKTMVQDIAKAETSAMRKAPKTVGIAKTDLMLDANDPVIQQVMLDFADAGEDVINPVKAADDFINVWMGKGVLPKEYSWMGTAERMGIDKAQDMLQVIGRKMEKAREFDAAAKAGEVINPSLRESRVWDYLYAKLSKAIDTHVGKMLPEGAAKQWADLTDQQAMAMRFGHEAIPVLEQRLNETGVVPAKNSLLNAVGPVNKTGVVNQATEGLVGWAGGGSAEVAAQMAATKSLKQQLQQGQDLVDFVQGRLQKPLPRSYARIATDPIRIMQFGTLAMQLGLIRDPGVLQSMPTAQAEELVGSMASMFPDAFEQSQSGYQSEANGRLYSPIDKDMHMKAALDQPAGKRAEVMGALYDQNKLVPLESPLPTTTETLDPWARLQTLESIGNRPVQGSIDLSVDSQTDTMLAKMHAAQSAHQVLQ